MAQALPVKDAGNEVLVRIENVSFLRSSSLSWEADPVKYLTKISVLFANNTFSH